MRERLSPPVSDDSPTAVDTGPGLENLSARATSNPKKKRRERLLACRLTLQQQKNKKRAPSMMGAVAVRRHESKSTMPCIASRDDLRTIKTSDQSPFGANGKPANVKQASAFSHDNETGLIFSRAPPTQAAVLLPDAKGATSLFAFRESGTTFDLRPAIFASLPTFSLQLSIRHGLRPIYTRWRRSTGQLGALYAQRENNNGRKL